jgi:hypothetical protein
MASVRHHCNDVPHPGHSPDAACAAMAQRYNYLSFNLGVLHKVVVTGFEASHALRGSGCRMEYALTSPDNRHLALCTEIRTLLGCSIDDGTIVGRLALGKTPCQHEKLAVVLLKSHAMSE